MPVPTGRLFNTFSGKSAIFAPTSGPKGRNWSDSIEKMSRQKNPVLPTEVGNRISLDLRGIFSEK